MAECVNCHILLRPNTELYEYVVTDLSPELISITEEWCGHEVSDRDCLCQGCVGLVIREGGICAETLYYQPRRQVGHECVCICCGISLIRRTGRRRHKLLPRSKEHNNIEYKIYPRQVPLEAWACHACWMQAHENRLVIPVSVEPLDAVEVPDPQQAEPGSSLSSSPALPNLGSDSWIDAKIQNHQLNHGEIELSDYRRTSDTPNRCFVPNCNNQERRRVPIYLKKAILKDQKLFITDNARVCLDHSVVCNWEILNEYDNFINRFNPIQISCMLKLLSSVQP